MKPKRYTSCKLACLLSFSFLFFFQSYSQVCTPASLTGGTTSDPNAVYPESSFYLFVVNSSTGSGLSYQWESSADNFSWPAIAKCYRRKLFNHAEYYCLLSEKNSLYR